MRVLVLFDHSFRFTSKLFYELAKRKDLEASLIYIPRPSYDKACKEFYKSVNQDVLNYYKASLAHFRSELRSLGYDLQVIRTDSPRSLLKYLLTKYKYDEVWLDKSYYAAETASFTALFDSLSVEFLERAFTDFKLRILNSDLLLYGRNIATYKQVSSAASHLLDAKQYPPEELAEMRAYVEFFLNNKLSFNYLPVEVPTDPHDFNVSEVPYNEEELKLSEAFTNDLRISQPSYIIHNSLVNYAPNRNKATGGTGISGILQHGAADPNYIVYSLILHYLECSPENINYLDLYAYIRQLLFRNKNIRLAQNAPNMCLLPKNLELICRSYLSAPAYTNLFLPQERPLPSEYEKLAEVFEEYLKTYHTLPNRARMFHASVVLTRQGCRPIDGIKYLLDLYNNYAYDGQSPNTYYSIIGSAEFSYGRILRYNPASTLAHLDSELFSLAL